MDPKYPRINPDRDNIRPLYLAEDVSVTLSNGDTITIEEGFRFDGTSIPWFMKPFMSGFRNDVFAALVHDWLIHKAPIYRYPKSFIDDQYAFIANKPEYFVSKLRRYFFPKAIKFRSLFRRGW